jgi:uncharacterized membrane protein
MWKELLREHPGKTVGIIGGLLCGIVYLFFGFWDMLIFAFISYLGYYIGKKIDQKEAVFPAQDIWDYLTQKWRMFR